MARKYYKKRKKYVSKEEQETRMIVLLSILVLAGGYGFYMKFIEPNLENIILFLKIFIPIITISLGLIAFYIYKNKKEEENKRINNIPNFLLELENKIKEFKPYKKFNKEEPYQIGLHGYLQNEYPKLEVEKMIDFSRPDIVIDNIAIEIKGPTNMQGLSTLPDKINKYLPKWDYLFIVLFDINIVEYKNKEENMEIYEDKKREILENTIESKRDKIFFIEI